MIACVNIFPIESMYWWDGEINKNKEFVIIAKTLEKRFDQVREEIKRVHSYEVPCILGLEVDANEEFLKWVEDEIEG